MKIFNIKNKYLGILALSCLYSVSIQSAQASSTFNSNSNISYTINSITNLTNAGSVAGLGIQGSFARDNSFTFTDFTGDGTASSNPSSSGPTALLPSVGSNFSQAFQATGNAGIGFATANYLGLYALNFSNTSNDTFQIDVQLDYSLLAITSGESSDSNIFLDYLNESESFSGGDSVYSSIADATGNSASDSVLYSFTLSGLGTDAFYVDVDISGTVESTVVPVPAAVWLFVSALMALPGVRKFSKSA